MLHITSFHKVWNHVLLAIRIHVLYYLQQIGGIIVIIILNSVPKARDSQHYTSLYDQLMFLHSLKGWCESRIDNKNVPSYNLL